MNLVKYINDLLYRYDCVIIPDFGGFVSNKIGAKIDENTHIFYPPTKQITFNSYLKHNDGLLANHISASENISFEQATQQIAAEISLWNAKLHITSIELEHIGSLSLNNEKQLVFEPKKDANFLIESFGLASVQTTTIEREITLEDSNTLNIENQEEKFIPEEVILEEKESKVTKTPTYIKYAASIAILMTLGVTGYRTYQINQNKVALTQQQEALEQKIQEATFVIDNPLPTINLSITKTSSSNDDDKNNTIDSSKAYHIIAGAFRSEENAKKKVKQLQQQGFNASIVGKNKWDLVQVAYESYANDDEAKKGLKKIKHSVNKKAWMLVKTSK